MIKEYDIVRATTHINGIVPIGASGTVLIICEPFGSVPRGYVVEFVDEQGETIAITTVTDPQIEPDKG